MLPSLCKQFHLRTEPERITPTGELEPMEPDDLELVEEREVEEREVEEREVGDDLIPTGAVRARRGEDVLFVDVLRGLDDLTPVSLRLELDVFLELEDLGVNGLNWIRPPPGVIFLADLGDFDASVSTRVGTPHLKFSVEWNKSLYIEQSTAIAFSNCSVCDTALFILTASAKTNVLIPSGSLRSLGLPFVMEKSASVFRRLISLSIFSNSGNCFLVTPSRAKVLGTVEKYLYIVTFFDADFAWPHSLRARPRAWISEATSCKGSKRCTPVRPLILSP